MAYWEVWEKLILNKPVTLQGKCKREKNGAQEHKDSLCTYWWYLYSIFSNILNLIYHKRGGEKVAVDEFKR